MSLRKKDVPYGTDSGDGTDAPRWGPVSFVLRADSEPWAVDESNSVSGEGGNILIEVEPDELGTCRFERRRTPARKP